MPDKRFAVRPEDILYVERACTQCPSVSAVPLGSLSSSDDLQMALLSTCPSCGARVDESSRTKLMQLLEALRRIVHDERLVLRIVFQDPRRNG